LPEVTAAAGSLFPGHLSLLVMTHIDGFTAAR
jgi:hypothetical protein